MPDVTMKLKPSHEGLAAVSRDHPDDEFLILDSHVTTEGILILYEIRTTNPASVVQSFDGMTDLHSYEILHTGEKIVLVRCQIDEPAPFRAARSSGNLARGPLTVHNGWITVTFTTSNEVLARYKDELESADVSYQIVSKTSSSDPVDLLTERQWEVIVEAVDRGYYETPRECSLTDLATDLRVTKGTMSRVLHRAEGSIIKEFVVATPSRTKVS